MIFSPKLCNITIDTFSQNWIGKILLFITLGILSLSCSNREEEIVVPAFSGYYRFESFVSSEEVDLNDDGLSHQDLEMEIDYYFGNMPYDLEVRPQSFNANPAKIISFYFPHPYLVFYDSEHSNYYLDFARSATGSPYRIENGNIHLENPDFGEFGKIAEIQLLDNDHIQLVLEKDYYDFSVNNWKTLVITAQYGKTSF